MELLITIQKLETQSSMENSKSQKYNSMKSFFANLTTPSEQSLKISQLNQRSCQSSYAQETNQAVSLDPEQLAEEGENQKLSEIVSNLISKNKINSKNAFEVPLLNVSNLRYFKKEDDGSWSKISSTLENSSKVYGFRVDSVNESINKMTNIISRSVQNQASPPQIVYLAAQNTKEKNSKLEDYDQLKINLHLDEVRCNEDLFIQERRKDNNSDRLRRLLDQNGVSALILGNVPITQNLCIDIENNGWNILKKQIPASKISNNFKLPGGSWSLGVANQIERVVSKLNYREGYEQWGLEDIQLNSIDNFTRGLEDAEIQLQETYDQNPCKPATFEEDSLIIIDSTMYHCSFQSKADIKAKKCKVKKQGQAKIRRKCSKFSHEIIFESENWLNRQEVMKNAKMESNSNLNKAENQKTNLFLNLLFPFETEVAEFWLVGPQPGGINAQKEDHNLQATACFASELPNAHESQFLRSEGEEVSKYLQISENKEQICMLLNQIREKIEFTKLHRLHKEITHNCSEALDFLSVLHLGNELGLTLTELGVYDFLIKK